MSTGSAVSAGDLITSAKMNLKLEVLSNAEEASAFGQLRFLTSGALPAGSVAYIGLDNTNDVTVNALTGGIFAVAINGTDEYTFSASTFTVASGNSITVAGAVDTVLSAATPILDIGADVFVAGTFIDIAYDTAETLTGALIGINIDLDTNVTADNNNVNGIIITMPGTYGSGTEVGLQITGDSQTINISNDTDLYISLAKASSVDINFQGVSPVIDIGADVFENGTFIDIAYDTAETLSGASLIGQSINLNTNVTNTADTDVFGYRTQTAALTSSGTATTLIYGFDYGTAGAMIQDTAAGTLDWRGVNIQLPTITQTTGTVTAYGVYIVEGTTNSGAAAGIYVDVDIAIDLVTLGNRIDLDADNDTSIRASADDVITWEIAGTDRFAFQEDTGSATGEIRSAGAVEIGFNVTNGALTVGSEGSIVLPDNAGVGSDAVFGDLNGCIGYDSTNNTIEIRDGGSWLSSGALTGYAMSSYVPWINKRSGGGWYHPDQIWSGEFDGHGDQMIDETRCAICAEPMEPAGHEHSRALTFYPNGYLEKEHDGRRMLHNIFGHAHPEREPVIKRLMRKIDVLAQRLGFDDSEELLAAEDITQEMIELQGAPA